MDTPTHLIVFERISEGVYDHLGNSSGNQIILHQTWQL